MTAILLAIALVLAVGMAYLPVTFIGWTELDASGSEVCYTGLKASRKRQEQQVSGTITMVKEDGRWKASAITLNL